MTPQEQKQYRAIGGRLAVVLRQRHGQLPAPAALQAIAADLVGARTELLLPLKDLVSRPGFQQLIAKAGSGGGAVERRALLADLEMTFTPAVISALEELLGGFLDLPSAAGSATAQVHAEPTPGPGFQETAPARQAQPSAPPSPQPSAPPPHPPAPQVVEVPAPPHPQTRGINPVVLALGVCIATASVVVAGTAAMRSPLLCSSLGLCSSNAASTAAEQALDAARRAVADLERATSLVSYRNASAELERALQRLGFIQKSLTHEQQQQWEMLGSISRKAKAALLQEEADQEHLQQAEMALAAGRQRSGAEQQEQLQAAAEALESIAAGGFAAAEASRLQKEIAVFQIEQPLVEEEAVELEPPAASTWSAPASDVPSAAPRAPAAETPIRPAPKASSDGGWRERPLF